MRNSNSLIAAGAAVMIAVAAPARAVDGCKVLLCLAGPWQRIAPCVSEVEQLFRDLWNGDPFPSCSLASGTPIALQVPGSPGLGRASAANTWLAQWVPTPDPNCPPQLATTFHAMGRTMYGCRYVGVIAVHVDGHLWTKTYWSATEASATELSAAAQSFSGMGSVPTIGDSSAYASPAAMADAQANGGGGD